MKIQKPGLKAKATVATATATKSPDVASRKIVNLSDLAATLVTTKGRGNGVASPILEKAKGLKIGQGFQITASEYFGKPNAKGEKIGGKGLASVYNWARRQTNMGNLVKYIARRDQAGKYWLFRVKRQEADLSPETNEVEEVVEEVD